MKFLPLIWVGMWRRPGRAALTLVSMICAFVLFGVLQGFSGGLDKLVADAHADLLFTESQVSEIDPLPVSLEPQIAALPGVKAVAKVVFMGGPFRGTNDFIPVAAVVPAELRVLARLSITPDQWAALARDRAGALVPIDFARLHDLKVGDRIPLKPNFVQRKDGAPAWPVDVVGLFPEDPYVGFSHNVIINYDYVDQGRATGAGTVHIYDVRIDNPARSGQIAAAIDRLSTNSPHATRTFSDRQLALAAVAQIGQVGLAVRLIMGAVFFALLFSVGAVMIQSARERTGEVAVLKTLGFGDVALTAMILAEALIFCLIAAAIGLALSSFLYPMVMRAVQIGGVTAGPITAVGLAFAVGLALIVAAVPAWRASRLSIVDALAGR